MPKDKGPGPKYQLPPTVGINNHDPTKERAPGFSFGSRRIYSYNYGPGPYYIESGVSNKGKDNRTGFSLLGRPNRSVWEMTVNSSPGPSYSYQADKSVTEKASPRYSFGLARIYKYSNGSPGPNKYNIPSTFGNSPAVGMQGRNDRYSFAYDYAKSPGPIYSLGNSTQRNAPAYSMGQRISRPRNKQITPGPDTYNPPLNNSPASPRFTMGVRHHDDVIPLADVSD